MRRILIVAIPALVLCLVGGSAWAGSASISVPGSVEQNRKLKVKAFDCESRPDWSAVVRVEISDHHTGDHISTREVGADDDGSTTIKIKMRAARYPIGMYLVVVTCIHEFDDGSVGTWYEEQDTFHVVAR